MKYNHRLYFICFSLLLCFVSISVSAGESFSKGLSAYNQKQYEEARSQFSEALKENPQNVAVMLNLALSFYQLGQKGMALGYLSKAVKLDPAFQEAVTAIEFVKKDLKSNAVPSKESTYEYFNKTIASQISLNMVLFFAAFTLLFSGFLGIRYLANRKKAHDEELDSPDFPVVGVVFLVLFLFSGLVGAAKIHEAYTPRAIVLADSTSIKLTPGQEQADLFVLNEGSEVLVGQIQNDWVQVTYPGSYTGWVLKEKIFLIK